MYIVAVGLEGFSYVQGGIATHYVQPCPRIAINGSARSQLNLIDQVDDRLQRLPAPKLESNKQGFVVTLHSATIILQVNTLLKVMADGNSYSRSELMGKMGLLDREFFRKYYLEVALSFGAIERTILDKPNSRNQTIR